MGLPLLPSVLVPCALQPFHGPGLRLGSPRPGFHFQLLGQTICHLSFHFKAQAVREARGPGELSQGCSTLPVEIVLRPLLPVMPQQAPPPRPVHQHRILVLLPVLHVSCRSRTLGQSCQMAVDVHVHHHQRLHPHRQIRESVVMLQSEQRDWVAPQWWISLQATFRLLRRALAVKAQQNTQHPKMIFVPTSRQHPSTNRCTNLRKSLYDIQSRTAGMVATSLKC